MRGVQSIDDCERCLLDLAVIMICDFIDDLAAQSHSALIILHMLGVIFFHLNSPSLSKAINSLVLKKTSMSLFDLLLAQLFISEGRKREKRYYK